MCQVIKLKKKSLSKKQVKCDRIRVKKLTNDYSGKVIQITSWTKFEIMESPFQRHILDSKIGSVVKKLLKFIYT